jgi:flagellar biosynthesis protein FlhG
MDQAERLRMSVGKEPPERNSPLSHPRLVCPQVLSVTSGKGGVGKTNVVANLALAFTQIGKRVLVFDADLGLANIDVLLGLTPQYSIEHLLNGEKSFFDILVRGPGGMSILPASSGVFDLVDLNDHQKIFLLNELDLIVEDVDVLLIDTCAGISSNVMYFNTAAQESIVVVTPEPTSMTDAYALIKVLSTKFKKKHFMALINFVPNAQEAKEVYRRISMVAERFLESISIEYLGFIPLDEKIPLAVRYQRPVLELYPRAPSSKSFVELAKVLSQRPIQDQGNGHIQFFLKQLLQRQSSSRPEEGID